MTVATQNDLKMKARTVGSGYTVFQYMGKTLAYLQSFTDTGQRPVAGAQVIHPLASRYPTEIVTPRALGAGTLVLSVIETWNEAVWEQLAGLTGTTDIIEIFDRLSRMPNYVTCSKIINAPDGTKRGRTYHRCVITDIDDSDSVDIGTLNVPKAITIMYCYATKIGR